MKHLTEKDVLEKIVEYWLKNHKEYITGKPEKMEQPDISQWILQSYINYEDKNSWHTDINMSREFDEIFKYILGSSCNVHVLRDHDPDDDYHKSVYSYIYHKNSARDCLAFQEYGGCSMEEHEEIDFIVKTVLAYQYTIELNQKYHEFWHSDRNGVITEEECEKAIAK